MIDDADPPRLSKDGGSPAERRLAALVESSRADVGTHEQVLSVETRLVALIGTAAPGGAPPGPGSAAGGGAPSVLAPAAIKAVAAVAVTLAAVGSGIWISSSRPSGAPKVVRAPSAAPAVEAPPVASVIPETPPGTAPSAPVAEPDTAPSNRSALPGKALPAEPDLIGQAQSALSGNPARALALCERHRQLYPHGVLVQEREVLAVEALERLGRHREAVARGERFLKAFPGSAHRNKIFAIVGGG